MRITIEIAVNSDGTVKLPATWLKKNGIKPESTILADIDDSAILIMPKGCGENE